MYRVVSFDIDDAVFCFKVHYKSRTLTDCWTFVERHRGQDFVVIDKADQVCDRPATGSSKEVEGGCVFVGAGNKLLSAYTLGRASA